MIDLHCHSIFSDGTCTPKELVDIAICKGITTLALTDHDTVAGIDDLYEASKGKQINIIPGIEFSTFYHGANLHIVGLFIDYKNPLLEKHLAKLIESRNNRNHNIVHKLQDLGINITVKDIEAEAQGESIGRPHIARALITKGYCQDIQEAFNKYLRKGKPAYVTRYLPQPTETVKLIHKLGGVAIWAHPFSLGRGSPARARRILNILTAVGLDGLECYYSDYDQKATELALSFAKEYNILASGGSDFHGDNMGKIELGTGCDNLNISEDVYNSLQEQAAKHKK